MHWSTPYITPMLKITPTLSDEHQMSWPQTIHAASNCNDAAVTKKLSYWRGTARCLMSVEILSTAAQYEKSHWKKLTINEWSWRLLKIIVISMYHLLLVVCSNNVSIPCTVFEIDQFAQTLRSPSVLNWQGISNYQPHRGPYAFQFKCFS